VQGRRGHVFYGWGSVRKGEANERLSHCRVHRSSPSKRPCRRIVSVADLQPAGSSSLSARGRNLYDSDRVGAARRGITVFQGREVAQSLRHSGGRRPEPLSFPGVGRTRSPPPPSSTAPWLRCSEGQLYRKARQHVQRMGSPIVVWPAKAGWLLTMSPSWSRMRIRSVSGRTINPL
jgi:hypothetical protein